MGTVGGTRRKMLIEENREYKNGVTRTVVISRASASLGHPSSEPATAAEIRRAAIDTYKFFSLTRLLHWNENKVARLKVVTNTKSNGSKAKTNKQNSYYYNFKLQSEILI